MAGQRGSDAGFEPGFDEEQLVTGEAVALDLRPASFVLRAAGTMIDFVVTVLLFLGVVLLLSNPALGFAIDQAALSAISLSLIVTLVIIVPTIVETLSHGRSLGKLAVGVRIVRDDGGAIGFRHAFIRALTGFLELFATFGALAALVALLNSRSKRLGDLLAGTYSRHERVSNVVEPVFDVPPSLAGWAETADVARMPDRLSRRIATFTKQAGAMSAGTRARLSASLSNEAAAFVNPIPQAHPELFLVAIAAIRRDREAAALRLERERMQPLTPLLEGLPHGFPDRA